MRENKYVYINLLTVQYIKNAPSVITRSRTGLAARTTCKNMKFIYIKHTELYLNSLQTICYVNIISYIEICSNRNITRIYTFLLNLL